MTELFSSHGLIETCWKYLLLGIVQGLTEFLPISSTAHVQILPMLMGWGDPGLSIAAVIQLGSIFAVVAYFRKDLGNILQGINLAFRHGSWQTPEARLGIAIGTGSLPIIFAGMGINLFWIEFENSYLRSIPSIGLISILMAIFLGMAEKRSTGFKTLDLISGKDGFLIGLGQIFALIPGVSRSGITLSTALFDGWKRDDAARFSFLLGIPAISLAGLVKLKEAFEYGLKIEFLPLIIGIISAAVVSWVSIDWLLKYLQKNSIWIFVAYRLIFGLLIIIWWSSTTSN